MRRIGVEAEWSDRLLSAICGAFREKLHALAVLTAAFVALVIAAVLGYKEIGQAFDGRSATWAQAGVARSSPGRKEYAMAGSGRFVAPSTAWAARYRTAKGITW